MEEVYREALTTLRKEIEEKVEKGEKVEKEMLVIQLEGEDAALLRFAKTCCPKGNEKLLMMNIIQHGLKNVSLGLLSLCKHKLIAEKKDKFPFNLF